MRPLTLSQSAEIAAFAEAYAAERFGRTVRVSISVIEPSQVPRNVIAATCVAGFALVSSLTASIWH